MKLFTDLRETLINLLEALRRAERGRQRPQTVKLRLEKLEGRTVPSTFAFIGDPNNQNLASLVGDWDYWTGNAWRGAKNLPGVQDDIWLSAGQITVIGANGQVQNVPSPLNTPVPCTFDANFGGIVDGLDVDQNYSATITLNKDLTVANWAEIDGGTIAGGNQLNIGDVGKPGGPPVKYAATLTWTGGTLGGAKNSVVYVNSMSTAYIENAGVKTLDGRSFENYGTVNWDGAGNILLKNSAELVDEGTMNANLSAAATIDGNSDPSTVFLVDSGATFNVNRQATGGQAGDLDIKTYLNNSGAFNIYDGSTWLLASCATKGKFGISGGAELWFAGTTSVLDGSQGPNACSINGPGIAHFSSTTHMVINGTVNVSNVWDDAALLDDLAASRLIVNGTYEWVGDTWAGAGVTQIGTEQNTTATLKIDAGQTNDYELSRQVVNYGTITWSSPNDIMVTNGGSIQNLDMATFDIQVGQKLFNGGGAGAFTNSSVLLKSAGGDATISIPYVGTPGERIKGKTKTLHFSHKVSVAGIVDVDPGAGVAFDGGMEQDGGTITDSGTLTVAGAYAENAGTLTLDSGTVVADSVDVAAGAVLSGDGSLTANVNNAGEVDADASGNPLTVFGAYTQTAGVTNVPRTGALTIAGALDEQGGAVNLTGGSLQVNDGYSIEAGAVLNGNGTITADLTNSGTIQVGDDDGSDGLAIAADSSAGVSGNLTETNTGVLDFAIASLSSYDAISVAGAASLNGARNVQMLDGFTPSAGQWFDLESDTCSGQFATWNQLTFGDLTLVPEYNAPGHPGYNLLAEANTSTWLSSSSGSYYPTSAPGQAVTFTATVSGYYGNSVPSGSVAFYADGTLLGTGTLTATGGYMGSSQAQAAFTTSGLSLGSHTITAVYRGDGVFAGSTASPLTQTVQKLSTWASLTSSSGSWYPTSAPGQAVTFTVTLGGDYGYAAPTGDVSFFDNGSLLATETLAATTGGTMGNVQSQAAFTTSDLALGTHAITAEYDGDSLYLGSTAYPLTQTVQQVWTSTSLTSSSGYEVPTSAPGQAVTFTATVYGGGGYGLTNSPTGAIQFFDNGTLLATVTLAPLSGYMGELAAQASFTTSGLSLGSHSITAIYAGDAVFAASSAWPLTQTVQQVSTWTSLSSDLSYYSATLAPGQSVTFTATVGGGYGDGVPTGFVVFYDNGVSLGTVAVGPVGGGMEGSEGQAAITTSALTLGSHTITAVYEGDATFAGSTAYPLTLTVQQSSTYTWLSSSSTGYPPTSAPGQAVTFTATVSGGSSVAPTGTVCFYDNGTLLGVASVTSGGYMEGTEGQATLTTSGLSLGSHTITAFYSGDAADGGSTAYALTQIVQETPSYTWLSSSNTIVSAGQSVTFTAGVYGSGGTPTGTVTFMEGTTVLAVVDLSSGTMGAQATFATSNLSVGEHSITAVYGGDSAFSGGTAYPLYLTVQ